MSAKEQAIQDIQNDLRQEQRVFIPFRVNLNPVMRRLTIQYQRQQNPHVRKKTQLMAHCFFCKGKVELNNYSSYYDRTKC